MSFARGFLPYLGLAGLLACSGAPRAWPPPSRSRPAPLPASAPPPRPSLAGEEAEEPFAEVTVASPLPAHAGRLEPVPLPRDVPEILAVSGRGERDVWMLAKGGRVLQWDGERIEERGTPRCFAEACCGGLVDCSRRPSMCSPAKVAGCGMGRTDCALAVEFDSLQIVGEDVLVGGSVDTGGLTRRWVDARLRRGRGWSCEQEPDDGLLRPGAEELSVGGASLRFETPAHFVSSIGGYSLLLDGRRVPLPEEASTGFEPTQIVGVSSDDLWLWTSRRVWRGNGLAWYPLSTGLSTLHRVWVGASGVVWVLGDLGNGRGEQLVRWDLAARTARRFPTKAATHVLAGGERGFWVLGTSVLYQWDGREVRRASLPIDLSDAQSQAWLSPSGDLWIVGADGAAASGQPGESARSGAAFRLRAVKGPDP